jgi:hypothetical protein
MIRRIKIRLYNRVIKDIFTLVITLKVAEGEFINSFEYEFANYLGMKYSIAVSSGRIGLSILLDCFNLEKGSEIIMPAYTLNVLVIIVEKKGFRQILVDVDESSFNINTDFIEKAITPRTKIIIATHIFGLPCDIKKILDISKKHNIKVIEDCAHALGAELSGKKIGAFGDASFFSFENTKLLNTFGGGMISTNNRDLAEAIRKKIKILSQGSPKFINSLRVLNKIIFTFFENILINGPSFPFLVLALQYKWTGKIMSNLYLSIHRKARVSYPCLTNLQALIGVEAINEIRYAEFST